MVPALATLLVFQLLGEAIVLARVLGAFSASIASLAPKPVTMPLAMGIAGKIGALPAARALNRRAQAASAASMSPASFSGASCGA